MLAERAWVGKINLLAGSIQCWLTRDQPYLDWSGQGCFLTGANRAFVLFAWLAIDHLGRSSGQCCLLAGVNSAFMQFA